MAENTSNLLWGPVENFRDLLAANAAFQALCGVSGEEDPTAAAHAHIYCPALPGDTYKTARPWALVGHGGTWKTKRLSSTGWERSGQVACILEVAVPEAHAGRSVEKLAAAEQWFLAALGDIIEGLMDASAAAGALAISGIEIVDGPSRPPQEIENDEGDFYQTVLAVDWGIGE